jgi:hypothetical protein
MARLKLDEVSRDAFLMGFECHWNGGSHVPEGDVVYRLMTGTGGEIGYINATMLKELNKRGYSFQLKGRTACPLCLGGVPLSKSAKVWKKYFDSFKASYLSSVRTGDNKKAEYPFDDN